jgi:cyclic pyranopterin phosphate synthase
MVDVSAKPVTARYARATACVQMQAATLNSILHHENTKGDVLGVARVAGIMAAKRTAELIPLCHNLNLTSVDIRFATRDDRVLLIEATVNVEARTGVEMEALTAVSVAALTVYDMCKSADRGMVIQAVQLEEKSGGQSGWFRRDTPAATASDPTKR